MKPTDLRVPFLPNEFELSLLGKQLQHICFFIIFYSVNNKPPKNTHSIHRLLFIAVPYVQSNRIIFTGNFDHNCVHHIK